MKHFFKILLLVLSLLSVNSYSQSGWSIQSSGTFENLNAVRFADINTGWVVGNTGVLLKTTNGGNNWFAINTGFNGNNYSIQIISANTIVVGSDNYQYLISTNAGSTWFRQPGAPNAGTGFLSSIVFANLLTGYAIDGSSSSIYGVTKTTNGGVTWDFADFNVMNPRGIYFYPTTNKGWIVGKKISVNYAYTTDGSAWTYGQIGDTTKLNAVHFISSTQGMIAGDRGKIYKSTDGGIVWSAQISNSSANLKDVISSNLNQSWAIGENGTILNTSNGGLNWSSQLSPTTQTLNSIYMTINSNTGWIVGNQGIILKTVNGGVGVKQISLSVPSEYKLFQNYPNPFNPTTKIKFSITKSEFVKLKIFDSLGKEIAQLVNEELNLGTYETNFNASELPSGIYYYKLETKDFNETKKLTLLK